MELVAFLHLSHWPLRRFVGFYWLRGMLWWGNRGQMYSVCPDCNIKHVLHVVMLISFWTDSSWRKNFAGNSCTLLVRTTIQRWCRNISMGLCLVWKKFCVLIGHALNFATAQEFLLLSWSKEAAVLAKWLKGVTLAVAHANPMDEHAACFVSNWYLVIWEFSAQCTVAAHNLGSGQQCL